MNRTALKARLDSFRPYATVWEEERGADGTLMPTAVVFLTNRECPFRCVMCDLWVNTLDERVPRGAIPRQIAAALAGLPPSRQVKLYNAGSFFDPDAIPPGDDEEIARLLAPLERVVVEAHPAFLRGPYGERCLRFRDALGDAQLEVAIGLETADPEVLARLDKGMTLEAFARAAGFLARHGVALRVFILLKPPFTTEEEGVTWACRSLDLAAACGATASTVIPTRPGNAVMETGGGRFAPPTLRSLERVVEYGVGQARGRVFADLWDIERFFGCRCSPRRAERLRRINQDQRAVDAVVCDCGG
jgi:radical SAM enzyme (TIGR01210 family)